MPALVADAQAFPPSASHPNKLPERERRCEAPRKIVLNPDPQAVRDFVQGVETSGMSVRRQGFMVRLLKACPARPLRIRPALPIGRNCPPAY
jgi:hypothetical protein